MITFMCVTVILLGSPAGVMLYNMLHSLLLLPLHYVHPLLHHLLVLLPTLDALCKLVPDIDVIEAAELQGMKGSSG